MRHLIDPLDFQSGDGPPALFGGGHHRIPADYTHRCDGGGFWQRFFMSLAPAPG